MRTAFFLVLPALALTLVSLPRVSAQDAQAPAAPPRRPTRLEYLQSEDLERRANLLVAENKPAEAAPLLIKAAELRDWPELGARAVALYLEAGAYDQVESALDSLPEARRRETRLVAMARAARILRGSENPDWGDLRSRIRETPKPDRPAPAAAGTREARLSAAYILAHEAFAAPLARRLGEEVIAAHPQFAEARLFVSDLHRREGREAEADREQEAYARLDPEGPRARLLRVRRLILLQQKGEAEKALREILAGNPSSPSVLAELLGLYGEGDRAEEERVLREVLVESFRSPTSGSVGQLNAIIAHYAAGERWPQLENLLRALTDLRPGDPFLAEHYARALVLGGKPDEAKKQLLALPESEQPRVAALAFHAALAAGDRETAVRLTPRGLDRCAASLAAWLHPEQAAPDQLPSIQFRYRIPPFYQVRRSQPLPFELAAIAAAEEIIARRFPDVPQALIARALRLRDMSRFEEAGELMARASQLKPDLLEPKLFLWDLAYQRKDAPTWLRYAAQLYGKLPQGVFPPPAPEGARFPDRGPLEINIPEPLRKIREAQALMLSGEVEKAIPALQSFPGQDPFSKHAAERALGAAYLSLGEWGRAEAAWRSAGLRLPLSENFGPGAPPIPYGYQPQFLPADPPVLTGDGSRLDHYPLPYLAVEAARAFARLPGAPEANTRTWEFLLRLALQKDAGYLPAHYALGHLLKLPRHNSGGGPTKEREQQFAEADRLLNEVLKRKPGDLTTLTALGRWEEAARANSDSETAWRQIVTNRGLPRDLILEARRQLKRLRPDDLDNRFRLGLLLAPSAPEEALQESAALPAAALPPTRQPGGVVASRAAAAAGSGLALRGVVHWTRGDWKAAAESWQPLAAAPGGERVSYGYPLASLSGLARLAVGENESAEALFRAASTGNSTDPLPRLFLAWLARSDAEREYQLAAASSRVPPNQAGDPELPLSLTPVLRGILEREPECFPARYLLERMRASGNLGESGDYTAERTAARKSLETLLERFPNWSGPAEAVSTYVAQDDRTRARTVLAQERENRLLTLGARGGAAPGGSPLSGPGPAYRSSEIGFESAENLAFALRDGLLAKLGNRLDVLDVKSGALVRSMQVERVTQPVIYEELLITAVEGGLAAYDWRTGHLAWTHPWTHRASGGLSADHGRVVALAADGSVLCLDARSGSRRWEAVRMDPASTRQPPVMAGGVVVIRNDSGGLRALSLEDGSERWKVDRIWFGMPERTLGPIEEVLLIGERLILGGNAAGHGATVALDPKDGAMLWCAEHEGIYSGRRFPVRGRLLVAASGEAGYIFLNVGTGKEERAPVQVDRQGRLAGVIGDWLIRRGTPDRSLGATDVVERVAAWEVKDLPGFNANITRIGNLWLLWDGNLLEWRRAAF